MGGGVLSGWVAVSVVAAVALAANVPLGFWRAGLTKFSAAWFVAVHLSIPLIIFLRFRLGVSAWFIPLTLGMAVLGQLTGGRIRRRRGYVPPGQTSGSGNRSKTQ